MRRNVKRGMTPLAAGLLAIGIAVVATYMAFSKELPFRSHYEVDAMFQTANNLRNGSLVRIAGVNVGEVVGIETAGGGQEAARVTMRIDESGLPIHKDAELKIRPRILFEGNFFIDVKPGSPSMPELEDGETIPINQTAAPVQLDQVLTSLQSATREDLQTLLDELGESLRDEGARGINRSFRWSEAAYKGTAIVNEAQLGLLRHDLSGYLREAGRVAEALDRNPEQLKALITDLRITAGAFAARDVALSDAIGELPRTLRAGLPAFDALNTALPSLRRLAADLRPGVRSSLPAIEAQIPFVRQLRRLVGTDELKGLSRDLRVAVPDLARLNASNIPFLRENRELASCQNEVILPWSLEEVPDPDFPATGPVYQEQAKALVGLAGESRTFDANGQWFRVAVNPAIYATRSAEDRYLLTARPLTGVNPPPPDNHKRPPLVSDQPCETQERPDLNTIQGKPPASFRITPNDPAKAASFDARSRAKAVDWLRDRLKAEGRTGIKVADDLVEKGELPKLGALKR